MRLANSARENNAFVYSMEACFCRGKKSNCEFYLTIVTFLLTIES